MEDREKQKALKEIKEECESQNMCIGCQYAFVAGTNFRCLLNEPFSWGLNKIREPARL